jgi:23S rRNA maturation-related 3'-5' exoribonuclease YhaM
LIHHISRSAIIWAEAASRLYTNYSKYYEPVLHAILAHHGFREAGSPVAPKTRVAWLVHLCDNISARMDDADTFDIVHKDKSAS